MGNYTNDNKNADISMGIFACIYQDDVIVIEKEGCIIYIAPKTRPVDYVECAVREYMDDKKLDIEN